MFFMSKSSILCQQSLTKIRIRIRIDRHCFGFLDSDPDLDPH